MDRDEVGDLQQGVNEVHDVIVRCLNSYGDLNDLDTSPEINQVKIFDEIRTLK